MNATPTRKEISSLITNGYAETHVGYHAEYRNWQGEWVRGCYAQIAASYGETKRIYAHSYAELMASVRDWMQQA